MVTLAGFSGSFGIIKVLVVTIYALLIMKTLTSVMYGIKILNKRKIKKITKAINNRLQEIETLTKELKELKTKSNYQVMPYSETHINPMKQPTKHNIYKIKRLVPNKK